MLQQLHGHSQSARRHVYVGANAVPRGAGLLVVCAAVAWEGAPGLLRRGRAHFDGGEGRRRVDAARWPDICIGHTTQALSTWARSTPAALRPAGVKHRSRTLLCYWADPALPWGITSVMSGLRGPPSDKICGSERARPGRGRRQPRPRCTEQMCWTTDCAHPALPDCQEMPLGHALQCRPLLLSAGTSLATTI